MVWGLGARAQNDNDLGDTLSKRNMFQVLAKGPTGTADLPISTQPKSRMLRKYASN